MLNQSELCRVIEDETGLRLYNKVRMAMMGANVLTDEEVKLIQKTINKGVSKFMYKLKKSKSNARRTR